MPVVKAPREVSEMLAELCQKNYPDLDQLNLRIGCVFATAATNDEGIATGPGLTKGGYEVPWVAKVTSPDQRLTGSPDVVLKLNGDKWGDWGPAQQEAVLDEFLYALEVIEDRETQGPATDDAGRVRLKLKKFDIYITGFERIVHRHKEATLCQVALDRVLDRLSQRTMNWD